MKNHLEKSFASLLAHLDIPEVTDNNRSNGYSGK
jgi:hypothetical protein